MKVFWGKQNKTKTSHETPKAQWILFYDCFKRVASSHDFITSLMVFCFS